MSPGSRRALVVVVATLAPAVCLAQAHAEPAGRSTGAIARIALGLFAILALAIVGGHPALRDYEKRAGLAMVNGSGIPFLLLGLVARRPEVGILDDGVLRDLRPLLDVGLGWIGFRVGTDFDVRAIDRWPRGTARVTAAESACALLAVTAATGVAMRAGLHPTNIERNAIVLGACAAVSAPSGARALERAGVLSAHSARKLRRVAALDDVTAVLVLALVMSAWRPVDSGWALPPLGWLFVQIGMGVVLGAVLIASVRVARDAREDAALTLGAVAFASGMAGYTGFSPLVIGCVAGVVVANLPAAAVEAGSLVSRARLREVERMIFMAFFVVAGALWNPTGATGWALVPVYVAARLLGKFLGLRAMREGRADATDPGALASSPPAASTSTSPPAAVTSAAATSLPATATTSSGASGRARVDLRRAWVALMPASAVSIAVVVSAHAAYPTILQGALATVVIVGAVASEVVFRASVHWLGGRAGDGEDLGALAIEHDDVEGPA